MKELDFDLDITMYPLLAERYGDNMLKIKIIEMCRKSNLPVNNKNINDMAESLENELSALAV